MIFDMATIMSSAVPKSSNDLVAPLLSSGESKEAEDLVHKHEHRRRLQRHPEFVLVSTASLENGQEFTKRTSDLSTNWQDFEMEPEGKIQFRLLEGAVNEKKRRSSAWDIMMSATINLATLSRNHTKKDVDVNAIFRQIHPTLKKNNMLKAYPNRTRSVSDMYAEEEETKSDAGMYGGH
jgi:hypothetical protein